MKHGLNNWQDGRTGQEGMFLEHSRTLGPTRPARLSNIYEARLTDDSY